MPEFHGSHKARLRNDRVVLHVWQNGPQIEAIKDLGYDVFPLLSAMSYETDTRFGKAQDFIDRIEAVSYTHLSSSTSVISLPRSPQPM